jgi:hypothetical protein
LAWVARMLRKPRRVIPAPGGRSFAFDRPPGLLAKGCVFLASDRPASLP